MNAKHMLPAWTNIAHPIYQSPDQPHQAYNNSRTDELGTLLSAPTLSGSKIEEDQNVGNINQICDHSHIA
jgi:hypothetical protein